MLTASSVRLQFIEDSAVEVILLIAVISVGILALLITTLELVTVHAASYFFGNFLNLALVL